MDRASNGIFEVFCSEISLPGKKTNFQNKICHIEIEQAPAPGLEPSQWVSRGSTQLIIIHGLGKKVKLIPASEAEGVSKSEKLKSVSPKGKWVFSQFVELFW